MASSLSDSDRHRAALNLAREIRRTREESIERIRDGSIELREALESDDPFVRHIKVVVIVESLPQLGKIKARRILDELGVSSHVKIHELDQQQRHLLIERSTTPSES